MIPGGAYWSWGDIQGFHAQSWNQLKATLTSHCCTLKDSPLRPCDGVRHSHISQNSGIWHTWGQWVMSTFLWRTRDCHWSWRSLPCMQSSLVDIPGEGGGIMEIKCHYKAAKERWDPALAAKTMMNFFGKVGGMGKRKLNLNRTMTASTKFKGQWPVAPLSFLSLCCFKGLQTITVQIIIH